MVDQRQQEELSLERIVALGRVLQECRWQDYKWGIMNHPQEIWLAILTEEVGEYAEAVLKYRAPHADNPDADPLTDTSHNIHDVRRELSQVAAAAIAALECSYRRDGSE